VGATGGALEHLEDVKDACILVVRLPRTDEDWM